jgi:hypothetical protein
MKKEQKKITISIEPEIYKKLEAEGYNKSKLINLLLTKHFNKKQENS